LDTVPALAFFEDEFGGIVKVLFALFIGCLLLTTAASGASFVVCTTPADVASFPLGTGSAVATCPGITLGAGETLDSIDVRYSVDYTYGTLESGNIFEVMFIPAPGFIQGPTYLDQSGGISSGLIAVQVLHNDVSAFAMDHVDEFVISEVGYMLAGGVDAGSAKVEIQYNILSDAPEPATMTLIGASLVSLAFIRRRRKN
jgi:hypothetical protein